MGFSWSPGCAGQQKKNGESVLCFWSPEAANSPAVVKLVAFPSRSELRSKNLFNVADCKMIWQDRGDFLCVQVSGP